MARRKGIMSMTLAILLLAGSVGFSTQAEEFKGISVWEGREQFVRIVPKESGTPNKQPTKFTKTQLRGALSRVGYSDNGNDVVDLFTKDEINVILPYLIKALASAGPGDDIIVNSIGMRRVLMGFTKPQILSARLFVDENGLNILVGEIFTDAEQGANAYLKVLDDQRLKELKIPNRAAPLDSKASWVLKGQDTNVMIKRQDWAVVPPDLWIAPISDMPPEALKSQQNMQNQLQQMQQQIQQMKNGGGSTGGFVPPTQQPSAVAPLNRSVEDRIKTLDDLKAKGLLSPEEYDAKRKHILDAL